MNEYKRTKAEEREYKRQKEKAEREWQRILHWQEKKSKFRTRSDCYLPWDCTTCSDQDECKVKDK